MGNSLMARVAGAVALVATAVPAPAWASPAGVGRQVEGGVATSGPIVVPTGVSGSFVTLDGHGNGHGIGMSQWGALGYAVDDGWDAERILAHYYGGTVAGTVDSGDVSVRLVALDEGQTAVVQPRGHAVVVADPLARAWTSVVAREVSEGTYRVWGATLAACPAADANLDDPTLGWTVVVDAAAGQIAIVTQTDVTATSDVNELLAVCEPNGTVRSYRGQIRAANGSAGENRTVNDLPMEHYLRSVVPAEMSSTWGPLGGGRGQQALMVQAVAARSYAAVQTRYSYAKTCDTQACQVYLGAARRAGPTGAPTINEKPETDLAIAGTAGEVRRLGSAGGPIANTMFSSSSGGYTAPSTSPGFPAVVDDGDDIAANGHHSWTAQVPISTIEQAWPQIGRLTDLVVTKRNGLGDFGGRVVSAVISGTTGQVTATGDDVRKALNLRSNWFSVRTPCLGRDAPPVAGDLTATDGQGFVGVTPTRIIDTRNGVGTSPTPIKAGCTLVVAVPNAPVGTTAAAVTLTTTRAAANGFTTAYPCGTLQPNVSAGQILAGRDVPATTVVPVGPAGTICVFTSVDADLIIDVLGWFAPGGHRFTGQIPERLLDTRRPVGATPVVAGTVTRVQVAGASRPADATGVSVNLTATGARVGGYVTAFPCGGPQPNASVLNLRSGVDVANHAFVALDAMGGFCLWNSAPVHLIADVDGWYAPAVGSLTSFSSPRRVVDSRSNVGTTGPWTAGESRAIDVGDAATAVVFELSGIDAQQAGYLTAFPCGSTPPDASVLNVNPGANVSNLVVVPTDTEGRVCLASSVPTQVLVDLIGRSVTPPPRPG